MQLFYANGGGPCYIVSVGDYSAAPAKADLSTGLAAVGKYDEPTILLFPDATKLTKGPLGTLQQEALTQSATLMDRIAVFDLQETATGTADFDEISIDVID